MTLLDEITNETPVFWKNPKPKQSTPFALTEKSIDDASALLDRFRPYLTLQFPETQKDGGRIESSLRPIPKMRQAFSEAVGIPIRGNLLMKCDNALPISGSIKARGGIYAVLKLAEELSVSHGLMSIDTDHAILADPAFKAFFKGFQVAVGSTGNLGLSIGIISAALGFDVTVHMSANARQWKKDLLRAKGASVIEYEGDYEKAVASGREMAVRQPNCTFIDDENSVDLFLGYAVAARRLKAQLNEMKVTVDPSHPLCIYLPCGVGGGPGGITFGLKLLYGDSVRCFFAEPTQAPGVTLGLSTGRWDKISAADIGLTGSTAADGLAVKRPSRLVCEAMAPILDGCYTVRDDELFASLGLLAESESVFLEPSACAGFPGLFRCEADTPETTHIIWATGGSMVPPEEMERYLALTKNASIRR